jgi:2-polyprenyl-6-methoxyphenol hydroxylase-like FAD-dependent oxidoreductase
LRIVFMASHLTSNHSPTETPTPVYDIVDVQTTNCCIVGGGPAGAVLALLLARQGIPVMLLEAHKDFDRDFRGDTIHPSVMEIMEELGLADRLLQLPHAKMHQINIKTPEASVTLADFSHLHTRYPYITMLPQARFLEFITAEAQKYPNFQLIMGANVQELIEEDGVIQGVRYRGSGGWHEIRATLTVGADGRHSRLRQLAEFESIQTSPPMDVLWFRLPKKHRSYVRSWRAMANCLCDSERWLSGNSCCWFVSFEEVYRRRSARVARPRRILTRLVTNCFLIGRVQPPQTLVSPWTTTYR